MSMMRSVALVVVISLVSGGCTSYKTIALENATPTAASLNVKQGDTVRVTLKDGTRHTFKIQSVSDAGLTSKDDGRLFLAAEIVRLEHRHYSAPKTVAFVLTSVAMMFLAALAGASGAVLGGAG